MKKVLALLLTLCLCVTLSACTTMETFESNLGDEYSKTIMDDNDLEVYADLLDLEVDDYSIKSAIEAEHKTKYISVVIIQCANNSKARKLANDAEDIIDMLENTFGSSYSFDLVVKNSFVLVGETNAIGDALGK